MLDGTIFENHFCGVICLLNFDGCNIILRIKMIDVLIAIAPFIVPFGMLTFQMNMINEPIAMLFMWLKDLSFNLGSMCLIFIILCLFLLGMFMWLIIVYVTKCCCIFQHLFYVYK